jgi:hypothetical protein
MENRLLTEFDGGHFLAEILVLESYLANDFKVELGLSPAFKIFLYRTETQSAICGSSVLSLLEDFNTGVFQSTVTGLDNWKTYSQEPLLAAGFLGCLAFDFQKNSYVEILDLKEGSGCLCVYAVYMNSEKFSHAFFDFFRKNSNENFYVRRRFQPTPSQLEESEVSLTTEIFKVIKFFFQNESGWVNQ